VTSLVIGIVFYHYAKTSSARAITDVKTIHVNI